MKTTNQKMDFDTVQKWFAKAEQVAVSQGRKDAAALWHDGLAWLKYWHHLATDGTR